MNLNLRKLRSFIQIAEAESFTRAAAAARIAQSALSRQIRELESQFGEPLFYRTGHGATLTKFGTHILPRVRALVAQADQLALDIADRDKGPVGEVALGVVVSLDPILMAPMLDKVRSQFPGIRLRVMQGLWDQVEQWLNQDRVDAALLYETSLYHAPISEELFGIDMYLVCAAEDASCCGGGSSAPVGTASLRSASARPLVLPSQPSYLRKQVDRVFQANGLNLQIAFEIDSTASALELVARGGVHSLMPLHAIVPYLDAGKIRAARLVDPAISMQLVLATPRQRPISQATMHVIKIVREEARALSRSLQDRWGGFTERLDVGL